MSHRTGKQPEDFELQDASQFDGTAAEHDSRREEIKAQLAQMKDDSSSWWAWVNAGWWAVSMTALGKKY